jgi:hypothetical protein
MRSASFGLNMTDRDRRALRIGALALVPALLWAGVVRPYRALLEDVRDRTVSERALLERELGILGQAVTLPAALVHATEDAERAELRLVHASNIALAEAELTTYLEGIALLSRVLLQELRGVEPGRGEAALPELRPIRLAIRGESDLEGVITFLSRVERSPLLLRVTGVSMEPEVEARQQNGRAAGAPPQLTGVVKFGMIIEAYAPPDLLGERVESAP